MTGVQVHPDEDSMAFHMQLIREHMAQAFEFLDAAKSYQVYGTPSDTFVEELKQTGGAGGSCDRQVQLLWVQPSPGNGGL